MRVIVFLDDKNGMLFNKRRQSRDQAVLEEIQMLCQGKVLWMNEYSSELFRTYSGDISVSERFLEEAGEEEYCFVENVPIQEYKDEIQTVVLYRWNRKYPADIRFAMDLSRWKMVECVEFSGHSHEKITKEVYVR